MNATAQHPASAPSGKLATELLNCAHYALHHSCTRISLNLGSLRTSFHATHCMLHSQRHKPLRYAGLTTASVATITAGMTTATTTIIGVEGLKLAGAGA